MRKIRLIMPIGYEVYQKIKHDILENKLKPGEKLVEEELAAELNVSRTPVREALKQLDQDGLVTYYPRKGSVVSEISLKDAAELYDVREVLEGLAIKQICINISRPDLERLKAIICEMNGAMEKNDYEHMRELHKLWSNTTIELLPNGLLKDYLTSITENLGRLRKISLYMPEQGADAYMETKEILNAIVNNEPEESERLARIHVRNAKKRFEKNMKQKSKTEISVDIRD